MFSVVRHLSQASYKSAIWTSQYTDQMCDKNNVSQGYFKGGITKKKKKETKELFRATALYYETKPSLTWSPFLQMKGLHQGSWFL